jgi:ribosome-associated protein
MAPVPTRETRVTARGPRSLAPKRSRLIEPAVSSPLPDTPPIPPPGLDANRRLALRIAEVISDTPAADTLVLDIHAVSPVADFFVICSGENERQLRAIGRELLEQLSADGVRPARSEGSAMAGWILLDYGDVIVHIFSVELRAFYRLEELWSEAQTLLAIQ